MTGLTLRGITKRYGAIEVIHGVDLDVQAGEFVVFVGPSGRRAAASPPCCA